MTELRRGFRAFVAREKLFGPQDRLLLAVSGGLDSCTLAHLLATEGYTFGMAHCNYQLRGEDSDGDERWVRELATRYGCAYHGRTAPPPHPRPAGFNLQIWARQVRYDHFKKILDEYHYTTLLTAHQLDDNLETQLLNLLRGTGLSGMRGVPLQTAFPVARPLLFAGKADILAYALAEGLTWRDDRTNAETDYLRNRLRHTVIPGLRAAGLTDDNLRRTFDHLRSAERFYQDGLLAHPAVTRTEDSLRIDRTLAGLGERDLLTLLWHYGKNLGFTEDQFRQLATKSGAFEVTSATHRAVVTEETILFRPKSNLVPVASTVERLPATVVFGHQKIRLDVVEAPAVLEERGIDFVRIPQLPLHLRARAPGDRFDPLGMQGRKKVKDFFIDQKVPHWERDLTPVLVDSEGRIVAIVGHRIANSFAVGPNDERVLRIRTERASPELP
ncbi:tRNA(Ile)-lysidine synthase [Neolewinella xylanilytica]|uniref:tRNA(Ile)-lysidine synthase n=1 Tax=Neolewinella xylanilytica TaxID=1514080 RepID=A0A2S6I5T6_9BACT|nr:tRNA lysidine(34) synthetase TilS [Neolewinella xylanilytica]PPK86522.1 tRNA(Ile)-lysidine synthase [Neolewinella xylanilytica]